jgi:hypothetical protein
VECAASLTYADAVLADDRLRAQGAALVPVGMLSGLPHDTGSRFAHPRSPPVVGDQQPIPALSCRSCRPHAPFAELVRLSNKSIADELYDEHTRRVLSPPSIDNSMPTSRIAAAAADSGRNSDQAPLKSQGK